MRPLLNGGTLGGRGASMLNWLRRRLGDGACTLCGRSVKEVDRLVAGVSGAVCDRCLVDSLVLLDDGPERVLSGLVLNRAERLTPQQRAAAASALAALANGRLTFFAELDRLVAERDGPACYPLLSRTDRKHWRQADWINFAWASCAVGDFAAVVKLEPDVPPSLLKDPDQAHLMRMNLVWARCHASTAPMRDELLAFVNEMQIASAYWQEQSRSGDRAGIAARYLACAEGTAAKCHVLLADIDAAIRCFETAAATTAGIQPFAALLWGDILATRGDVPGAQAKWALAAGSDEAALGGLLSREVAGRPCNNGASSG
jgi:ClpX C4-type zinc finger